MSNVEVESSQVAVTKARLPSHTSQTSKPISLTKDGAKGRGDFMPLMMLIALAVVLFFSFKLLNATTSAIGKVASLGPSSMSLAQNVSRQAWDVASVGGMRGVAAAVALMQWSRSSVTAGVCSNELTSVMAAWFTFGWYMCVPHVSFNTSLNSTPIEMEHLVKVAIEILPHCHWLQSATIRLSEQDIIISSSNISSRDESSKAIQQYSDGMFELGAQVYGVVVATDGLVSGIINHVGVVRKNIEQSSGHGMIGKWRIERVTRQRCQHLLTMFDQEFLHIIDLIDSTFQTLKITRDAGMRLNFVQNSGIGEIDIQIRSSSYLQWLFGNKQLRPYREILQPAHYNISDTISKLQAVRNRLVLHRKDIPWAKGSLSHAATSGPLVPETLIVQMLSIVDQLIKPQLELRIARAEHKQLLLKQKQQGLYTSPSIKS